MQTQPQNETPSDLADLFAWRELTLHQQLPADLFVESFSAEELPEVPDELQAALRRFRKMNVFTRVSHIDRWKFAQRQQTLPFERPSRTKKPKANKPVRMRSTYRRIQRLFVIDTNSYAGNFERQMVAYVVGEIDEFHHSRCKWFMDECFREHGGSPESPPFEKYTAYRVVDHGDDSIEKNTVTIYKTPSEDEHPWPYNSVGIFLSRVPPQDVLDTWIKRAHDFTQLDLVKQRYSDIVVKGFRLVEERTSFHWTRL